jgi:predicted PurR-regulated permease PerM
VVTIAGGSLFGAVGLILSAPLTAAATKITADLSRARAHERELEAERGESDPPPEGTRPAPNPA